MRLSAPLGQILSVDFWAVLIWNYAWHWREQRFTRTRVLCGKCLPEINEGSTRLHEATWHNLGRPGHHDNGRGRPTTARATLPVRTMPWHSSPKQTDFKYISEGFWLGFLTGVIVLRLIIFVTTKRELIHLFIAVSCAPACALPLLRNRRLFQVFSQLYQPQQPNTKA